MIFFIWTLVALPRDYETDLRGWWNKANPVYAHIEYKNRLVSPQHLVKTWKSMWMHKLPSHLGHVAEYGIGAGLLGKVLLEDYNAEHYTGLDISDRQINASKTTLSQCCPGRFDLYLVPHSLEETHLREVDTFVSQAVIQHFPSDEYVNSFFKTLNNAPSLKWIMIQVREVPRAIKKRDVTTATSIYKHHIEHKLSSFHIVWKSHTYPNGYVFYHLQRS